ncbi:methylmalonyl-CoA mutase subunit beta [Cohaesibacter celericrescens]|uniref:Methylmalonyl-CoA mutase n=1 Tax=Cohaesibacter celericrescens TaxID=2067669 RepID=A0A2N5XR55_9HYPH|nr:methylmalonyl-CoA mutase subunit beta [Cohaesibacter celericrescens]PLW77006.1 methylmalonyl-CoA mutase [Cohaesibacter celericrescens]
MSDALRITETFPGYSHDEWVAVAEKALKGQPLSRISTTTVDGTKIDPIYERASGKTPLAMRPEDLPWAVSQRVDHPDADKANEQLLTDLSNGANMLSIPFVGCASAHGFGLAANKESLAKALDGVMLDLVSVRLEGGASGEIAANAFADFVADKGLDASSLKVSFGLDPIGTFASTGTMAPDWAGRSAAMIETIKGLKSKGFKGPFITVDGRPYHNAGASEAQELGAVVATIAEYWRVLEAAGFDASEALASIDVTLSAETNQFGSLSKMRAMRHLWANLMHAAGVDFVPLHIHAETSWAMMTRLDPAVNILRATTAAFAAGVGGADSVCILPHTLTHGLPDPLARRIARNLQTMLLEESNLYRVTDPAAGSGFVESWTDEMGSKAWALFQTIEQAGNMVQALKAGLLVDEIAKSNAARNKLIATRRASLTGASAFPNIDEADVEVLDVAPLAAPELAEGEKCTALKVVRISEPYEALRAAAKAAGVPTVFFANMGRIADFTARSTWAKNFFEAGGIRALSDKGFTENDAAVEAFKASGSSIACLVGPDGLYEERGADLAKGLKAAGAKMVYLAGRPKDLMEALSAAGVDAYAFESCDVLAELNKIHAELGIAPQAQG